MINERKDFETLDATRLIWPVLLFFLYSSNEMEEYMCVLKYELTLNEKRCLKQITVPPKSSLLFILWIFVFTGDLHFFPRNWDVIEFSIDSPKDLG